LTTSKATATVAFIRASASYREKLSYQLVGSGGAPHLASHNAAEAQCLFSITRFRLDRAWGLFRI
jgi:hypothetical protein